MTDFNAPIPASVIEKVAWRAKMYCGPEGTLNAVRHGAIQTPDEFYAALTTDETFWTVVPIESEEEE